MQKIPARDGDDLRVLPLHMRKTNLQKRESIMKEKAASQRPFLSERACAQILDFLKLCECRVGRCENP
jgi:hypothetical protein